ncbi:MAG: leucine-rich repeat domain-containing protein [Clostridiaceae bacterium]|nr:leucine-rich repeat domain-containing protein [Clostridiaceae bacterium]
MFDLWEDRVGFINGIYGYFDKEKNNSVISHERANELEKDYQRYQASMDIDRGGLNKLMAYRSRGLTDDGENLIHYKTDDLASNEAIMPIVDTWIIPEYLGDKKINIIAKRAFLNCEDLSELIIPKSVEIIGNEAFYGCSNLNKVTFKGEIKNIGKNAFKTTCLYEEESNWKNNALYINNWLIKVRDNYEGEFFAKDGTVGIADNAFDGCNKLTSIYIHSSVNYIGNEAFKDCSALVNIRFPEAVCKFGNNVFLGCKSLSTIKLPYGIKRINGFRNLTNLKEIRCPNSVTVIDREAFEGCTSLNKIEIPKDLKSIKQNAFNDTAFFNDKRKWKNHALYLDKWLIKAEEGIDKQYSVKEGTVGIASAAFSINPLDRKGISSLEEIYLPNSLKYIGDNAFMGCTNLIKINIPEQVECLNQSLFGYTGLREIVIPASVKYMDIWVFHGCTELKSIIIENPDINIKWPAFCCENAIIHSYENSNAKVYANKYKLHFIPIKYRKWTKVVKNISNVFGGKRE